jgi:hypothetical protein
MSATFNINSSILRILLFSKAPIALLFPVNHVTAMYKKSWVLNVGNYAKYRTSEDYNLFVKLIMAGAKIYNLQESLVSVRMGNEQQMRRGGLKNAMFEVDV